MNKLQGLFFCLLMFASSIMLAQKLTTKNDSIQYSLGYQAAMDLKVKGIDSVDSSLFVMGLLQTLDKESMLTKEEVNENLISYLTKIQKEKKLKVKKEGEMFLADNAKKDGVTTTESGLQYLVISKGDGTVSPLPTDKVLTHYHGTLIDGTVFDSSVDRGEPISFGLNQVIKGWTEGLQLMHEGDKFRFFIPSNLAYGERGAGNVIPPGAALIFDVELLKIL
ncbi:MAG TPA: FKBP-type peptidyl-prolyl cis-trans isomerase [Saprospiraceae bacterium]|nr:FKBP-type peptidyl-prolyl cis-trans isomerase [Saprospiraceae bacterium]MCB9329252.1 FKBP-type peptidyl-prolyl cis-trans isomerase [Lewinellaceae bacterium]HPK10042.1 FKBP-type peptidyl-prolyl cis-trans isomerase [Saprospiraceae bacterium]HRX28674.1 FKBP-type peptidyl-prolyl cis-trans isomerase [Saprospiraceae bacterium]